MLTRDTKNVDSRFAKAGISLRHAPLRDYPDIFSAMILRNMIRHIPQGEGIIHVHSYHDALTAIMARRLASRPDIRIIATRHKASKAVDTWIRRYVYSHIDAHIFVSAFARQRFLACWPDANPPFDRLRLHVAYNSLYPDSYPSQIPDEPGKGPIIAMFRGTIKPGKGLETLIDALSLLKDIKLRLRIVGNGDPDYIDAIRRRAATRGVLQKIDWTRQADNAMQLICDSHFGVFPSVEPEAFGMTNLEFMACGRPQISTLTGGQKEFLTPGIDSLESNPADAVSLAEKMRMLATDTEMRKAMGTAAYATYNEKYSWPGFIDRLTAIYL